MLPCNCSWCWDCSQWGRILVPGRAEGRGGDSGRCEKCTRAEDDQVDGDWVLTGSTTALARAARHSSRNYSGDADQSPFQDIAGNEYRRQSVKSRKHSSSDSDRTGSSIGNSSRRSDNRRSDVGRAHYQSDLSLSSRGYRKTSDAVDSGSLLLAESGHERALAEAVPRTVTVTQQPRSVDMFRPDIAVEKFDNTSFNSHAGSQRSNRSARARTSRAASVDTSHLNSPKKVQFRKISASYLSPSHAARLAVDAPVVGSADEKEASPQRTLKHSSPWRPGLLFQREGPKDDKDEHTGSTDSAALANGVVEKTALSRIVSRVVEGSGAARAKFEYTASKDSGSKVQLRSKSTADNIAHRKSVQVHHIMHYTFGYITVTYKCTKEKKLEVDVISVRKLPRYSSAIFGDAGQADDEDEEIPSLKYVSVEVSLRSQKGKQFTHLIKKFRTGDVPIDDEAFEPEFSHASKELEGSTLVLSVSRRGNLSCQPLAVGHALQTFTKKDVQDSGIRTVTFPLKHGVMRQDVKGSIQIVLSCSHPNAKTVDLSVDVRLVQHLDVSLLGINHASPDFKIKPEIKMRLQFLGSKKSSNKVRDFPWIELHNISRSSLHGEEGDKEGARKSGAKDRSFGGWGTMFSESCYFTRTAFESELKKFSVCFLVQVIGRNNFGPGVKKEVVLGKVILGPELLCAETAGLGMELSPPLTHWGQALNKRTSVEMLHRLHL